MILSSINSKTSLMKFISKVLTIFLFTTQLSFSAEQIGIIGFVIGDVFNQKGEKLNVGDSIFFGDTINAREGAKSQLMFIDQTVMTIGSKTELTIDEFIFDPNENTGKLLATIKSGSVKVLTGKISEINPENLEVKTPAGTIGTRGTEFKASVDPETTQSKILLVGPGPNNQLNLRAGAVDVSNEFGTVTLDQPYLFTELTQNRAPTEAVIIPQAELQKFQELEVEPQAPGSTEAPDEEGETQLAEGEEAITEDVPEGLAQLSDEEIKNIVKGEMFAEGQDEGDLIIDTLVAALAKDDGGITAQMLGKSFINSGIEMRPDFDLPAGMDFNSPEAMIFMEEKAMQELEKVMLVSARVKDVDYVPTKFNQFGGFDDIRVPILNDETGDIVFLDMGNIDFKPQVLPAGFNPDGPQILSRAPEQLFLKGGNENLFIDFNEGQFFEAVVDPEMEALDQRYLAAVESGATQEEIEEIFVEMDNVMQKADEAMIAIDMIRMENEYLPEVGFKMDFLSAEQFTKEQDSFLFDAGIYSESWDQAEEGKVAIFQIDGSVDYVDERDANAAWEEVDQAYEKQFAEAFPEIYQAEKKAEALMATADATADKLYSQVDELLQSGASDEEINALYEKIDNQMAEVYSEVDSAFEEVVLVELKTDIFLVAEEAAIRKADLKIAKETGIIDGTEVTKEELAAIEDEVAILETEIKESKDDYIEEVSFASKENRGVAADTNQIETEIKQQEIKLEQEIVLVSREINQIQKYYNEPLFYENLYLKRPEIINTNNFKVGATTYADLNEVSSGTHTYNGATTNLTVVSAGSSADADVNEVGEVAGSFTPTHTIDYSTRTITQAADITVTKLGRNTTARSFTVSKGHTYSSSDTGTASPNTSYNVTGDDDSNVVNTVASSLTDPVATAVTDGTTYVETSTKANTHYLVTVSTDIQNRTVGSYSDTIDTTVTVQTEQSDGGDVNKISGTSAAGRN